MIDTTQCKGCHYWRTMSGLVAVKACHYRQEHESGHAVVEGVCFSKEIEGKRRRTCELPAAEGATLAGERVQRGRR